MAAFTAVVDKLLPDIIVFSVVLEVNVCPIKALLVPDVSDIVSPITIIFSELVI